MDVFPDFETFLTEATKKRKVRVRAGKRQVKWKCPPGYKIVGGASGRCVKIVGKERINKMKATRKRKRTMKAKGKAIYTRMNRKRKRSNARRRGFGLK